MVKDPSAPFLELSFYFAELSETTALEHFVAVLSALGAQFAGTGYAHIGPSIQCQPFASIHDEPLEFVALDDAATLTRYLVDPNVRLIQVYMTGATGLVGTAPEILTYLSISPEASREDHHRWQFGPTAMHSVARQIGGIQRNTHNQGGQPEGEFITASWRYWMLYGLHMDRSRSNMAWNVRPTYDATREAMPSVTSSSAVTFLANQE